MISLLSPAKNMDFSDSSEFDATSIPVFIEQSTYLMTKLKKLSALQIQKLMKLNPQLADLNYKRNQSWNTDYKNNDQKAALLAFNGEVYRGLNAVTFSKEDVEYANDHLRILSGLHGLIKPLDKIQPYRLEMGSRLSITPKIKGLYNYWGNEITNFLNDELENHSEKAILNLASNEYFKVINTKLVKAPIIDFKFLDWKGEGYKSVMTWAKLARGKMAGEIIRNRIDSIEDLKAVSFANYNFNDRMSDCSTFVFTRDQLPS